MADPDRILAECLDRITSGEWTLAQALTRYPDARAEIEPLVYLAGDLRQFRAIEAPPVYKRAARERLLQAIEADRAPTTVTTLLPPPGLLDRMFLRRSTRLAGLAAGLLLLIGGSTAVQASTESLPGSLLYPLKTVAERIEVNLARTDDARFAAYLQIADRRLTELEYVAAAGNEQTAGELARRYAGAILDAQKAAALAGPPDAVPAPVSTALAAHSTRAGEVLERVLEQVPETARPAIQQAIEKQATPTPLPGPNAAPVANEPPRPPGDNRPGESDARPGRSGQPAAGGPAAGATSTATVQPVLPAGGNPAPATSDATQTPAPTGSAASPTSESTRPSERREATQTPAPAGATETPENRRADATSTRGTRGPVEPTSPPPRPTAPAGPPPAPPARPTEPDPSRGSGGEHESRDRGGAPPAATPASSPAADPGRREESLGQSSESPARSGNGWNQPDPPRREDPPARGNQPESSNGTPRQNDPPRREDPPGGGDSPRSENPAPPLEPPPRPAAPPAEPPRRDDPPRREEPAPAADSSRRDSSPPRQGPPPLVPEPPRREEQPPRDAQPNRADESRPSEESRREDAPRRAETDTPPAPAGERPNTGNPGNGRRGG